jgi:hypothetical protein
MKTDKAAAQEELELQKPATAKPAKKRTPPTSEQVIAGQKRDAERDAAQRKAALPAAPAKPAAIAVPAKPTTTAVATPDNRSVAERYVDDLAPSFLPGPLVRFDGKAGQFIVNGEPFDHAMKRFTALLPDVWIGWIKFGSEGEPPTRIGGLLYDDYVMPARDTLGDNDKTAWPIGLDGEPSDPWLHQQLVPLQATKTGEMLVFGAINETSRVAVLNLLRDYNRHRKTKKDEVPIIQLVASSFPHKTWGKVLIPKLVTCGWVKYVAPGLAEPELPLDRVMDDDIPF